MTHHWVAFDTDSQLFRLHVATVCTPCCHLAKDTKLSAAVPPGYGAVCFPQVTLPLFLYTVCHLESSTERLLLRVNINYTIRGFTDR